ncbi:UPF0149 family protein [Glaciecola siphonariae]|uniref:UPF0149 family protein n=1 Tax=Glaciecola siphonariae TaxID=521012 RepID=A0ABV9LWL0_9ALTE
MNLLALYAHPEHAQYLRSRYFVEGAITGACASPDIPLPDTWLPWTLGDIAQSQGASAKQIDEIFEHLFGFFKHTLAQMKENQLHVPDYAQYDGPSNSAPLQDYCAGVMLAHQSLEKLWASAWRHMQQAKPAEAPAFAKDLKHCLLVFSTFADPRAAIEQAHARAEPELEKKLPLIAQSLESTLLQYVSISGRLAAFLPNQFETFRQDPKSPA